MEIQTNFSQDSFHWITYHQTFPDFSSKTKYHATPRAETITVMRYSNGSE